MVGFETGSSVAEINRAIHPMFPRPRIIAVVRAYFDESSDGRSKRVFAAGGYVATEDNWLKFEKEWARRSGGAVFHLTDLLSGFGDFRGWSEMRRFDLVRAMIDVLNGIDVKGFHTSILLKDFREIFPADDSEALYFMCFQECFNRAAIWANELDDKVACFFDLHNDLEYRACRIFKHVQGLADRPGWEVAKRLVSITYGSRRQYTPLQSADLIASTGTKLLMELTDRGNSRASWWLGQMNVRNNLHRELWDADSLSALREEVRMSKEAGLIPFVVKKKWEAK